MKRIGIVLLVVALALLAAAPASAGKTPCDELPPDHPKYCGDAPGDPPPAGTTCAAAGEPGPFEGPVSEDFPIILNTGDGRNADACVDVIADEGAWRVTVVETVGTVRSLGLSPRDSFGPGDFCGGRSFRNDIPDSVTLPGPDHPFDLDGDEMIEGAYVNSCGTEFGEWVGDHVYYEVEPDIESPLAFLMWITGGKNAQMTLHVDLPPLDPPSAP